MLISEDKYAAILNFIQELFDTSFDDKLRSVIFDAPSLDHEAIRLYFDSFDNIYYMGHIFTEEDYLFPFYPYLKVIKDYFSGLPRQETKAIIESLNLYALHQNLYLNFIYDEDFSRQEEVLRDEVYYEKKLFLVDIGKLLNHIAGFEDIVIYLGELQYAPESTLDMTKYLLEDCISIPILLVGVLDADYLEYEENKDSHQDFVEALDRLDLMVRIDVEFVDESPYYKRGSQNKEEIYRIMEVCFQFLAISDCIYYGKQLYVTYNNQLNKGEEGQFIDLLKLLGKAHFLNRDKEGALFYDNMAYSLAESIGHRWDMCLCKINLGYDYSINGQFAIARKHANEAYEMADDLGYEALAYKAMLMNFVIDKESLYIESTTTEEQLETLIEGTIERGYNNYLAMIYTNPRELHHNFDAVKESRFALGIQLASQTGNDHQLGVAYHNQGIIYYQLGQIHLSFEYLQKSKLIKERIGDKKRLSYIYNSLGYYYFLIESYAKAHDEYLKSLIASGESGDYHEVCMTLYNMALNAFFFGKYTLVCNYISKLLDLMKVAKLQDIKYHSKKMIYDLYIIALVKTGHMSKARDIYNKVGIWKLKPIEDKDEEYFISEMMEFFMSHVEEDKEELLVKAEQFIPESDASLLHFRKFYFLEKMLYYKAGGSNYYKRLGKIIQKELDTDSMLTLDKVTQIMSQKHILRFDEPAESLRDIDIDYNRYLYAAKIDQNLLKLRNRLNEISFLNVVQNMLVNEDQVNQLFIRLQQLIHGNTKVEKSFCRVLKAKGYQTLNIESTKLIINEVYAERILHYVSDKSKPSILKGGNMNFRTLKKVYGYSSIMYLPIYVHGKRKAEFIFMTTDAYEKLNQDDLSIFTLVGRQVGESIERIENNRAIKAMNIKLDHLSKTDLLTNLYNRNALEDKLQENKDRIKSGELGNLIILFIDLDNFKYYNDTFGHQMGDKVLVYFAEFLKEFSGPQDFVARFGGDEFVVLLENRSEEEVHEIAHQIYHRIKDFHYFERVIGQAIGKQVKIPIECRLSCSIGMAALEDYGSGDVDDLLKAADLALYQAKDEGKNRLKKANFI